MTIIKSVLLGSVAAIASATFASASCQVYNGLTYCDSVSGISYENVGDSGAYKVVAGMKSVQKGNGQYECQCEWGGTKPFSGPYAPLNEGLSIHLRGPLDLKKFAFYQPGPKPKRNNKKRHGHAHGHHAKRHGHGHLHRRAVEVVTVTSTVVVNHHGETIYPEPTPAPEVQAQGAQIHGSKPKEEKEDKPKGGSGGNGGNNGGGKGGNNGGDDDELLDDLDNLDDQGENGWLRKAYFDADSGTTDGMVIMNYMGGEPGCSGEWTFGCGSSLSYASGPKTCTKGPSPLTQPNLRSDEEFIIFSSEKCGENDPECGFSYGPAHKGFAGDRKIFMFEFRMPEASGGDTSGPNYNIPAIWSLNARAPRTQQYGDCSCWNSGCGELDMFEVIKGAADKIKTHFHSKQGKIIGGFGPGGGGGSPDYFERPTNKFVKAAVIFDGSKTIKITLVPDNVDISEYFDDKYADKLKQGLGKDKFSSFTVGQ